MALHGFIKGGKIAALNDQAAFNDTDTTVQHLWQIVPDGSAVGDSTTLPDSVYVAPAPPPALPAPPAPASNPRVILLSAFKMRFPFAKYAAVVAARATDPGVAAWFDVVATLTEIDLDDPHTSAALDYFVAKGYIDAADKTAALV